MDKTSRQVSALFIAISFKSSELVLEALRSVQSLSANKDVGIIVIDNSSVSEDINPIRSAVSNFCNAELLESTANRGYFGAARFALDHFLAKGHPIPDWVIVCNHDILIEDREFFQKLSNNDAGAVGVIAPRIQKLPGNVDQNPFMRNRPNALRWAQLRLVSSNYTLAKFWDWLWRRKWALKSWTAAIRKELAENNNVKRESIYAPHGSFIIFSRKFFETGGFLDENLFLYGEEISVAEQCRLLGLPVVYEPELRVLHNEHQSTGKRLSRFTFECQKRAMEYVTARYWSRSPGPFRSCQPYLP